MRLHLLCEDRLHESVVRRFCDASRIRLERVFVAPRAKGAASAWVIAQYAGRVADFRSKANHQQNLALLAVIDGDNQGCAERKRVLDERLATNGRQAAERILVWVPTWSVETWLEWLGGNTSVTESQSYKSATNQMPLTAAFGQALRNAFKTPGPAPLSSLTDARLEWQRFPDK